MEHTCHHAPWGAIASALVCGLFIDALALSAAAGEGSPASGGLSRVDDAAMPPGPPGVVETTRRGGVHRVQWDGTRDDTILGYQVLRRCGEAPWEPVAFVPLHDDDPRNRGRYGYEDRIHGPCDYTVAAISAANEPGPTSAEIQ